MKKKIIYIIILIVVAIVLFLGGLFIGLHMDNNDCEVETTNDNNESSSEYTTLKYATIDIKNTAIGKDNNEETEKIEIVKVLNGNKGYLSGKYEYLYIIAKNNNDKDVDVTADLNFIDKDGYIVDYNTKNAYSVRPGKIFVMKIPTNYESEYKTTNIAIKTSHTRTYYINADDVTDDSFKIYKEDAINGTDITVNFTNNTEKNVTVGGSLLFYKDNEIVFANELSFYDVKPGASSSITTYSTQIGDINYDRYELVIYSSYIYETTWK